MGEEAIWMRFRVRELVGPTRGRSRAWASGKDWRALARMCVTGDRWTIWG